MGKKAFLFLFSSFTMLYACTDYLEEKLIQFIGVKTREIAKHELKQDQLILSASNSLNSLTIRYVFENPSTREYTAKLIRQLLENEKVKFTLKSLVARKIQSSKIQAGLFNAVNVKISANSNGVKIENRESHRE